MQTDIKEKEVLREIIVGLNKVRCYGFESILKKYCEGLIRADEAIESIREFIKNYDKIITLKEDGTKVEEKVDYLEMIQIGETDMPVPMIKTLTKTSHYDYKHNVMLYGIVINASYNENSLITYYEDEEVRDRELLKIKDLLSVLSRRKFN